MKSYFTKLRYISLLIFLIVEITSIALSQDFKVSELITIPGNNRNFDILSSGWEGSGDIFICWENFLDSIYTIYLKQIQPLESGNIIIASDTMPNTNPQIAFGEGIKIVWQSFVNNHWQLLCRNYQNDTLSNVIQITDSLSDNITPTLNIHRVAWINDGKLMVKAFYQGFAEYDKPFVIDSICCSNPDIYIDDWYGNASILYEKGEEGNKQIYKAEYSYHYGSNDSYWTLNKISDGQNDINPRFCIYPEVLVYQSFISDVWKIIISSCFGIEYISDNSSSNFNNPYFFSYPIPTKGINTDVACFFCAFDSDSLIGNQEIFIKTFVYGVQDTIINISKFPGIDRKPYVVLVPDSVAIIWEHEEGGKTDIWWGKDKFIPPPGSIDSRLNDLSDYSLKGNYPNPFNISTTIYFQVESNMNKNIEINIFNILGQLVRNMDTVINKKGLYSIVWDGTLNDGSVAQTGDYFYIIDFGESQLYGKMTLIK